MRCCGERLRNFEVFHIVIHIYIFSVTVRNRMRCCGGRLRNLEVRAGTKNDNTNEIVGRFKGPGVTGAKHGIQFTRWIVADFLTFQLKRKNAILQISEIYLNEIAELGKFFSLLCTMSSYTTHNGDTMLIRV